MIEKHEAVNDQIYLSLFAVVNIKRYMRRVYSQITLTNVCIHNKL